MVRGLRPHLVNRAIVRSEFCRCTRKPIDVQPARRSFLRQLRNRDIISVSRLGKRIVVALNRGLSLIIEPRMTGLLLITDPPTQEHRRLRWTLSPCPGRVDAFEFWDRRGLGTLRVMNADTLQSLRNRLGPDPLEMTVDDWQVRLAVTRRPVKTALLDQTLVAGIGNIYASEILHLARISPSSPGNSLSSSRVGRLAQACRDVLIAAISHEGSTLADGTYLNALSRRGTYQNHHRVYQKENRCCPTCRRGPIRRIVQAQRSTFYCPRCQRR